MTDERGVGCVDMRRYRIDQNLAIRLDLCYRASMNTLQFKPELKLELTARPQTR